MTEELGRNEWWGFTYQTGDISQFTSKSRHEAESFAGNDLKLARVTIVESDKLAKVREKVEDAQRFLNNVAGRSDEDDALVTSAIAHIVEALAVLEPPQ